MVAIKKGRGGISIPDVPEREGIMEMMSLLTEVASDFHTLHQSDAEILDGIEDEVDSSTYPDRTRAEAVTNSKGILVKFRDLTDQLLRALEALEKEKELYRLADSQPRGLLSQEADQSLD